MRMQWASKEKKVPAKDEQQVNEMLLGELSEDVLAQISGGLASNKSGCHPIRLY